MMQFPWTATKGQRQPTSLRGRSNKGLIHPAESVLDNLMDNFFSGNEMDDFGPRRSFQPELSMRDDEHAILVKVEVPGIAVEDLHISLDQNILTIKGEKMAESSGEDYGMYYSERRYGQFSRSIALPYEVNEDKVQAECKDGILSIKMEKAVKSKQKKLDIKVLQ